MSGGLDMQDTTIYAKSGAPGGFHDGKIIYDLQGQPVGQLRGSQVYCMVGHYVGELKNGVILDKNFNCGNTRARNNVCLLYTSPSPRDGLLSRMPSSA